MTDQSRSPGVLSRRQIQELIAKGLISSSAGDEDFEVDASAFDLRLGKHAWRIRSGQRPTTKRLNLLKGQAEEVQMSRDAEGEFFLFEKGQIYLVELDDVLTLPKGISGRATGRSSIGRLDVITRLITDKCHEYDLVRSEYEGPLHLLVLSQTFSIKVAPLDSLNQLRLFCGPQDSCVIGRALVPHYEQPICFVPSNGSFVPWETDPIDSMSSDPLQFDLTVELSDEDEPYVLKAKEEVEAPVDLRKTCQSPPDDAEYFDEVKIEEAQGDRYVQLEQSCFYLMKSRERLHIPRDVAVEVVAISERIGDIRIHYAGFAHPGFGTTREHGTPLMFEVRATDMATRLSSGSILARIQLLRMSEPVEDLNVDRPESSYEEQELTVSKVFKKRDANGR